MKGKDIDTKLEYSSRMSLVSDFLKGSRHYLFLTVVFVCLLVGFELVNPKAIGYTVDLIIGNEEQLPGFIKSFIEWMGGREYCLNNLYIFALIIIGIALIGAVCRYMFKLMNTKSAETLGKTMKDTLFDHIIHLPFSWHDQNQTGDIIQRCTTDVDMIRDFIANQMTQVFRMVLVISMSLVFMCRINFVLSVAAFLFIPIVVGYSLFFHGAIGKSFMLADTEEGNLSAIAQENLTGVRVVRAFGKERYEKDRFENKNAEYTKLWVRTMRLLTQFWTINDLIGGIEIMTVVTLGAYLTVKGTISAGDYVAFLSFNGMMIWPTRELGRVVSEMSKAGISIDRLLYIMNSKIEEDSENAVEFPGNGDIEFKNVTFSYDGASVLQDVSWKFKRGETIGILGGTGSGKTTAMMLLDMFYELGDDNGRITINGVDISNIKKSSLRQNIGMVMQEPYLFSGTLEDNIKIAADDVDHEMVMDASRISSLDNAIEKFTQGYDTYVGERGVTLSGGQKQRTAIAQMLVRKPSIMIFDDSLSAVDAVTDGKIRKALNESIEEDRKNNNNDTTVILISHRITTLMNADRIFVLDDGRVIESGNHNELVSQDGMYSKIYKLQVLAGEGGLDEE